MSGPIVYAGTYRVATENLDAFRKVAKEFAEFVEGSEPQLLAYMEYVSEDGTEASAIQLHPNSESMEPHLEVAGAKFGEAMALIQDVKIDLYGTPTAPLLERVKQTAQMFGVALTVHQPHAGFSRLPTG